MDNNNNNDYNDSNGISSIISSNPLIKLGVVSSAVTDLVHGYDTLVESLPSLAEKVNKMSIGIVLVL